MKRISVKGFRAINKEKQISLAPINLIIGPNGSGKSTLINSLLLSRGIFKPRLEDQASTMYFTNSNKYDTKGLYSKSTYDLSFMSRLINPFDNIGKFKKTDINFNNSKKEFSISHPIKLRYFVDSFKIELSYFIDKSNNALLKDFKLINESKKSVLLSASASNKTLNNLRACTVKIDVNYLIDFIEKVKEKNKTFSQIASKDYSIEQGQDISFDEMAKLEDEFENENKNWRKRFSKAFYAEAHCNLINSIDDNNNSDSKNLLKYYNSIEELNYFNYTKEGVNDYDIKSEPSIYEIALKFEKKWLELIEGGYEFQIEGSGFASCLDACFKGELPFYIHEMLLGNDVMPTGIEMFNIHVNNSNKTDFIFDQLLLNNLNESLKRFYKETEDIVYIPPNRILNYKGNKDISNTEIVTSLINKLNNIKFDDKWARPCEYFINYWLSEFNLKSKIKFNSIDDIISLFENNFTNDRIDVGYGVSQLTPLIYLFSLFNDNYKVSNLESAVSDSYIPTSGTSNCFLIEEPEANLHPSFQSKLADLFIDASWKFGHQFIIETHSEYMVRKFQYWVAKGKIKPSDVNIYYFDNKNDDPIIKDLVIKKININPNGTLTESFGEGFFDEAIGLRLELLKLKSLN